MRKDEPLNKNRSRPKEESSPSIPWQRRDMSRKEEYEFLEMNPFSDLSEFSLRYPHVNQRTYYRWKRRIKEEYIILEQCPEMTFDQFSGVVLQAKESVFSHWKSLIAQGKGFFAPSTDTSSKKIENKSLAASKSPPNSNFCAEYVYLQKNVSMNQEQFCRKFPTISPDIFNALKRKALQEFWLFYQNKQMSWKDISKILNISEDVYNYWKEYAESIRQSLESEMKGGVGGDVFKGTQMSPQLSYLESPSSPAGTGPHFAAKESMLNDPFHNHSVSFDSHLKSSVSRSLSASYLNSMHNMMLPWASYYNMASFNQQMLPMMLWPRMLGLGSSFNMNSMPSTQSSTNGPSLNPCFDIKANNAMQESFPLSGLVREGNEKHNDNFLDTSKYQSGGKRPSSESVQFLESEGNDNCDNIFKKQRTKEDSIDGACSPYSRSRKQNKQEYVYYLKNPELCFKDLETLFPAISVRTFYRWRKEMNAALLFIEENAILNFQHFKLVFPDIPEEVFDLWKSKSGEMSGKIKPSLSSGDFVSDTDILLDVDDANHTDSIKNKDTVLIESQYCNYSPSITNEIPTSNSQTTISTSNDKDIYVPGILGKAHLFLYKNPDVDYADYSRIFPDVTIHEFNKLKKEMGDALHIPQVNPNASHETLKPIGLSSISKDLINPSKPDICVNQTIDEEEKTIKSDQETGYSEVNGYYNRKRHDPEFIYLQLNPDIDFYHFSAVYPDVPRETFEQQRKDIHDVLEYMRNQHKSTYSDITSILPDVNEEVFLKWKDLVNTENNKSDEVKENQQQVDEEAKTRMTRALLYLMHNPNMRFRDFQDLFQFISLETFQMWLNRIKLVILHISSNPNLEYDEFSAAITDIGEDVFRRWKSLTSDEISAIGTHCYQDANDNEHVQHNPERDLHDARQHCQKHPNLTFDDFSQNYPAVARSKFNDWKSRVLTQISYVKEHFGVKYEEFQKIFDDVPKEVFELWKMKSHPIYSSPVPSCETGKDASTIDSPLYEQSKEKPLYEQALSHHSKVSITSIEESEENDCGRNGKYVVQDNVECKPLMFDSTSCTSNRTISEKENENLSMESSLSKLTKFAESDVSIYTKWTPGNPPHQEKASESTFNTQSNDHGNTYSHLKSETTEQLYKLNNNDIDNDNNFFVNNNNNNVNDNACISKPSVNNAIMKKGKLLNPLSTNISQKEMSSPSSEDFIKSPPVKEEYSHDKVSEFSLNKVTDNHLSENKSLSALMVMSTNRTHLTIHPDLQSRGGDAKVLSNHSSSSAGWASATSHLVSNSKEDDEIFSSQRQKKMSRAEYLFVKDNPDVDSQEFSRIFPGVSARTFYRWKKEIKAQIQI